GSATWGAVSTGFELPVDDRLLAVVSEWRFVLATVMVFDGLADPGPAWRIEASSSSRAIPDSRAAGAAALPASATRPGSSPVPQAARLAQAIATNERRERNRDR